MATNGESRSVEMVKIKSFDVVMGLLQAISLTLCGWILLTIIDHGQRLTAIEANRYTSQDALIAERAVASQLSDLWRRMGEKADTDDVPPPEVLRRLESLEHLIQRLDERINPPTAAGGKP